MIAGGLGVVWAFSFLRARAFPHVCACVSGVACVRAYALRFSLGDISPARISQ